MSDSPKRQLIVNADDFGFSLGISEGIVHAHREGIVTSTTIAANMPDAEASLAMLADVPTLGVGVHLNASQGPVLSQGASRLVDVAGEMNYSANGLILACAKHPSLLDAVQAEYEAQIQWCFDHGITPTHLDSHRHAHGYWPIFRRVVKLARRYNVRFIRRHRERLPGSDWPEADKKQRRTATILNLLGTLQPMLGGDRIVTTGTWGVAQTGNYDAAWLEKVIRRVPTGVTELMTHPGKACDVSNEASRLRESRIAELQALCDPCVRAAADEEGIELIHYGTL
jgi:chitin disaccharide deacetylase